MQLLRVSTLDRNSPITARRRAQRIWEAQVWTSGRDLSSGLQIRWGTSEVAVLTRPLYASSGCCQRFSPWAGILLSVILFSPRSLLPGQMHTNAFRSSTDKEWTRFRGSNVSDHLVKWHADVWRTIGTGFHIKWQLGGLFLFGFFGVFPWQGRQLAEQNPCSYESLPPKRDWFHIGIIDILLYTFLFRMFCLFCWLFTLWFCIIII